MALADVNESDSDSEEDSGYEEEEEEEEYTTDKYDCVDPSETKVFALLRPERV